MAFVRSCRNATCGTAGAVEGGQPPHHAKRYGKDTTTEYFGASWVRPTPTCRLSKSPRPRIEDAPNCSMLCTEFAPFTVTPLKLGACTKFCCRTVLSVVSGLLAR